MAVAESRRRQIKNACSNIVSSVKKYFFLALFIVLHIIVSTIIQGLDVCECFVMSDEYEEPKIERAFFNSLVRSIALTFARAIVRASDDSWILRALDRAYKRSYDRACKF